MATSHQMRRAGLWARLPSRLKRQATTTRRRTVELVDAGTLLAHLLTLEAFDAATGADGRYVALCGAEVLPAALVEPGQGTCRSCAGAAR